VTDDQYLTPKVDRVHWRVFNPKPADKELSVARIELLDPPGIWGLGDTLAGGSSHRTVYGRADFDQMQARGIALTDGSLDVIRDDPPARHAIIVGWPDDKNARKTASMRLAAVSVRHIRTMS
jgi:hypothetical protein